MWKRRSRDIILRAYSGDYRISAIIAQKSVKEAASRWNHAVDSVANRIWGEYMVGAMMLNSFYKGEERIKVSVVSNEIHQLYVETMSIGEVRGKILLHDKSDVCEPQGHMNVSKILYGATKAYETTVEASGSAQEDWQRYFDLSEQVPTVVRLSSKPENGIWLCCGFTIQQIAGYPGGNSHLYLDEVRYSNKSTMTEAILSGMDPITYLNREILPAKSAIDENTVKRIPIDYFCRCSKRSYAASLIALGSTELESIHKSGGDGFNLTCNFCNECHYFSSAELDELIELCNFQK